MVESSNGVIRIPAGINVLGNLRSFRVHLLTGDSASSGEVGQIPQFGVVWHLNAQPTNRLFSVHETTECVNRRSRAAHRGGRIPPARRWSRAPTNASAQPPRALWRAAGSSRTLERAWRKFAEWADDDRPVAGRARRSFALAAALVRVARMTADEPQSPLALLLGDADQLAARVDRLLRPAPPTEVPAGPRPILAVSAILLMAGSSPAARGALHRASGARGE